MALRGVGATRLRLAREQAAAGKRKKLPWQKKGLSRVGKVLAFLEFLPITKGPLAGQQMKLLAGQREFVERIYGEVDEKGIRKTRIGIKSEPKGNGKTGLVAGLCLCHLVGPEAEPRGEIYSAAIDRSQAALIFAEMEAIIYAVPDFAAVCNPIRHFKKIEVTAGPFVGSMYEALSADARRAHGLAPSLFAYDELAQAKDRILLDNLINGLGKRREALGLVISTQAPDDEHPLSQLIDDGLTGADTSIFVQLLAAPEDADIFDEATWRACNPALGRYLSVEEMRQAAERARRLPSFEPAFRNLRLNQRVDAATETRVVTREVWNACKGRVPELDELDGSVCYAGLDLSGKHDLSALVLAFPDDAAEPVYRVHLFAWTPEGAMESRRPQEQAMFREWIRRGFLTAVPGPVVRYGFIARQLAEIRERFDLRVVAYDRWRIDDLKQELDSIGVHDGELPLEGFGQGYQSMSPAIEWFAELAMTGRLVHAGNPVLTHAVTNSITVSDPAGNLKLDKSKGNRGSVRIDPAVAMIMALGAAKRVVEEKPREYQMMFV
jgi:phage terminase large subunit-like protein